MNTVQILLRKLKPVLGLLLCCTFLCHCRKEPQVEFRTVLLQWGVYKVNTEGQMNFDSAGKDRLSFGSYYREFGILPSNQPNEENRMIEWIRDGRLLFRGRIISEDSSAVELCPQMQTIRKLEIENLGQLYELRIPIPPYNSPNYFCFVLIPYGQSPTCDEFLIFRQT
jgi:hypothetical protein